MVSTECPFQMGERVVRVGQSQGWVATVVGMRRADVGDETTSRWIIYIKRSPTAASEGWGAEDLMAFTHKTTPLADVPPGHHYEVPGHPGMLHLRVTSGVGVEALRDQVTGNLVTGVIVRSPYPEWRWVLSVFTPERTVRWMTATGEPVAAEG